MIVLITSSLFKCSMFTQIYLFVTLILCDQISPYAVGEVHRIPNSRMVKETKLSRHQWALPQWVEVNAEPSHRQVRRTDSSELLSLDLEVFRRMTLSPKPVWKDPDSQREGGRKKVDDHEAELMEDFSK